MVVASTQRSMTKGLFTPVQEKNAVLSDETYLAILDPRNAERREYMTRLDRLLDGAQRRKMFPNERVLLSAAMAYARVEMWQKAMLMFEQAVSDFSPPPPH